MLDNFNKSYYQEEKKPTSTYRPGGAMAEGAPATEILIGTESNDNFGSGHDCRPLSVLDGTLETIPHPITAGFSLFSLNRSGKVQTIRYQIEKILAN